MCSPAFVYISASRAFGLVVQPDKSRKTARERERDETDRPKEIAQTFRFEQFSATARHFRVALVCGNWARLNLVKVEAILSLCNFHESVFIFLKLCQCRFKEKNICTFVAFLD